MSPVVLKIAIFLGGFVILCTFFFVAQGAVCGFNQTHFWNNRSLTAEERASLFQDQVLKVSGDSSAIRRLAWWDLRFHLPLSGGWKKYVVLKPIDDQVWYVGWSGEGFAGRTLIKLTGAVRMLRGPDDAGFFAFDEEGRQIRLQIVGYGTLCQSGPYSKLPLL